MPRARYTAWAVALLCLTLWIPRATADESGFRPIFDGQSLEGWDGDPDIWRVEDGAITGETTADRPLKVNNFLIWRQGEVDDFELRLEFRQPSGNSGIQYRSWEEPESVGRWVLGGYQADMEAGPSYSGILYGERFRGILALRGQKATIGADHKPTVVETFADAQGLQSALKPGQWNEYRIVAQGYHILHEINGQKMVEVTDEDAAMRRRRGLLGFQVHMGAPMKVQFRNIRLKRLPLEDKKKVVFISGPPTHGYGDHELYAGSMLLAKRLNENTPSIEAVVYRGGWPKDPTFLDNADALVMFVDGAEGHPALPHLAEVNQFAKQGKGIAMFHWGVEVPKGEAGDAVLEWTGGYFEKFWSVNPFYNAKISLNSEHPITRGVKPFEMRDEWYYHMRFRENMEGVTAVFSAIPPDDVHDGPDGERSGNAAVRARKGQPEVLGWARQRPDGGRGFGFTGAHTHWHWGHDQYRKLILNALVWTAGLDVPAEGVVSPTPTVAELRQNLSRPDPPDYNFQAIKENIQRWNAQ